MHILRGELMIVMRVCAITVWLEILVEIKFGRLLGGFNIGGMRMLIGAHVRMLYRACTRKHSIDGV